MEDKLDFNISGIIVGMIFSELDNKIAYYSNDVICIINNFEKINESVIIKIDQICFAFRFNEWLLITTKY